MKNIIKLAITILLATVQVSSAQTRSASRCGIDAVRERLAVADPGLLQQIDRQHREAQTVGSGSTFAAKSTEETGVIPVVFHIILTQSQFNQLGGESGIEARVISQVGVLNEDFNRANYDSNRIPEVFKPLYADVGIRFGLAHRKPDGNGNYVATPGYEIKIIPAGTDTVYDISSGSRGSTFFCSDAKYNTNKGLGAWDPVSYLNVWVVKITDGGRDGILGVAAPPSFVSKYGLPRDEQGVVVNYSSFGRRAGPRDYYYHNVIDRGRTLVHEIGHFFELDHIWGIAAGCGTDDGIADTPPQDDANYGCPTFPKANCTQSSGGEMFMNYMDYVDDKCMQMFTQGQADLMKRQVAPGGKSYSLTTRSELTLWPVGIAVAEQGQEFFIAPNPANGQVVISVPAGSEKLKSVSVLSMTGQVIKNISLQSLQSGMLEADLSDLAKGVYIVQCRFEAVSVSRKLVLQ